MEELIKFLREKGFDFTPTEINEHSHYEEFNTGTRKGWFVASQFTRKDGTPILVANFGDWRTGEKHTFKSVADLTSGEQKKFDKKAREQQLVLEEKKKLRQEASSQIAAEKWPLFSSAFKPSKYLVQKKMGELYGARVSTSEGQAVELVVPMRDLNGRLWGYQTITEDGAKFYLTGQKMQGLSHLITSDKANFDVIYICEGFATGAAVHAATKLPVFCAFQAGNLGDLAKALRGKYPQSSIIVAGDNDQFLPNPPGNVGMEKAESAAKQNLASCVFPKFQNTESKPTDFNDLLVLEGIKEVTHQLLSHRPIPPTEIIRTEHSGFHSSEIVKGREVLTPEYEDLRRYFDREHSYKMLVPGRLCYVWTGKHYEEFDDARIEGFAQKHFYPKATNHMAKEFLGIVQRTNFTSPAWFDECSYKKINFQNGYLDIETNTFRPHSPKTGFKYVLGYDYEPEATCPNFDKMLNAVTNGDEALQKILLEFTGYCLSNDSCWTQKALVLEGQGSNGKSTFMNVLHALAGQTNTTSLTFKDLNGEYNRQTLDGKLFNLAEETPSKSLMDSSLFKNLVAGGSTSVRPIFKPPYTLRVRTKFILSCNHLPESEDTSYAFVRRFIIVPFRQVFDVSNPDFDPFIEGKLMKELPGIFNKALAGYKRLLEQTKFTGSTVVDSLVQDYKEALNPLIGWLRERLEVYPVGNGKDEELTIFKVLYDLYKADMDGRGERSMSYNALARKLRHVIPDYSRRKDDRWIDQETKMVLMATKLRSNRLN